MTEAIVILRICQLVQTCQQETENQFLSDFFVWRTAISYNFFR